MRDGAEGLEVLLLKRNARAGFVPCAHVFPGGRVDPADAMLEVSTRIRRLVPERAAERLGLPDGDPPAIAYYVAAVREVFEETGILLGIDHPPETALVARVRDDLLEDRITFAEALERLDARVAGDALEYLAHWITPEREPRRYDTRFFAARAPEGAEAAIDAREMTAALWVGPTDGLRRARAGELQMILPTVATLRQLAEFGDTTAVLKALPGLSVPTILPPSDVVPDPR